MLESHDVISKMKQHTYTHTCTGFSVYSLIVDQRSSQPEDTPNLSLINLNVHAQYKSLILFPTCNFAFCSVSLLFSLLLNNLFLNFFFLTEMIFRSCWMLHLILQLPPSWVLWGCLVFILILMEMKRFPFFSFSVIYSWYSHISKIKLVHTLTFVNITKINTLERNEIFHMHKQPNYIIITFSKNKIKRPF